jgi:hypothetical protein
MLLMGLQLNAALSPGPDEFVAWFYRWSGRGPRLGIFRP